MTEIVLERVMTRDEVMDAVGSSLAPRYKMEWVGESQIWVQRAPGISAMVRVKSREGMSVLTVGPAGQIPVLFIYNWLVTRKQVAQAVARALGAGSEHDP